MTGEEEPPGIGGGVESSDLVFVNSTGEDVGVRVSGKGRIGQNGQGGPLLRESAFPLDEPVGGLALDGPAEMKAGRIVGPFGGEGNDAEAGRFGSAKGRKGSCGDRENDH